MVQKHRRAYRQLFRYGLANSGMHYRLQSSQGASIPKYDLTQRFAINAAIRREHLRAKRLRDLFRDWLTR